MDCRTGQIFEFGSNEALRKAIENEDGRHLVPITNEQKRSMSDLKPGQRKNYMRNQPCVCRSGKKFKACCWSKYK